MRDPLPRSIYLVVVVAIAMLGLAGCTDDIDPVAHHVKASAHVRVKATGDKTRVTHRIVRERERVPFARHTRKSRQLDVGAHKVSRRGRVGVRVKTFRVTTRGGDSSRRLVRTVLVHKPVSQITIVGTRVRAPDGTRICDSNYAGCVPFASDVDCAGGDGNGPAYVSGPVRVVGIDVYDLDSDGDGIGCN